MENKNKRTQKRFQAQKDEESRSLLKYEGGAKDKKSEKAEKKEEEKEDPKHCGCCQFTTAITVYGILLWVLGLLVFADICTQFANKYFPLWYPLVGLFIFFIFLAGLVLITTWYCKDSSATRTSLKLGGWLILGSTIVLIFWAIIYVWAKESAENPKSDDDGGDQQKIKTSGAKLADIKLGTGDDDDDYHDQSNGMYILGYLLWGAVIITFTSLLLYAAFQYDDVAPKDEGEEDDKKSEKSKGKK